MKPLTYIAMVIALLWPSIRSCATEKQRAISATICRTENELDHAEMRHDRSVLTAAFSDEYQHINFLGAVSDKNSEIEFFTCADFALEGASVQGCTVRVYKHLAVATGINNWNGARYRGRDLSGQYRFTRVYVLRDGRWQIVASHASQILHQP